MARSSLRTYRKKRDFALTAEPSGRIVRGKALGDFPGGRFVLHEHHASALHFDLRLEMGGVLKSWAVPKGPSLDPEVRRLAVQTEDHPVQYLTFRGSIADGQYGAGEMRIWDTGRWSLTKEGDPEKSWEQGRLHILLEGDKLHGAFMLVRTARDPRQWLFFKLRDEAAVADWTPVLILPYGANREKPDDLEALEDAVPAPKPLSEMKRAKTAAAAKAKTKARSLPAKAGKPLKVKFPSGAARASLPTFIQPMLATLADAPFDDEDWVFETKWDGWRALLRFDGKSSRLISRSGKSLDPMFPDLADLHRGLKAKACILDGEVVALDGEQRSRFQLLQNRLKGRRTADGSGTMIFYVFDILHLDGHDLTGCSLLDRKALLRRILPESPILRYSEHFPARGKRVFQEALRLGFEGILAKRAAAPYYKGRSADWLKVKVKMRQEVVIAGMTRPRRSRAHFGSLVAGLYGDGKLTFAGHVGGGFDADSLETVYALLSPLAMKKSPFETEPKTNEPVTWVKPLRVAEVEFAEWTEDGRMRQPVFMGMRPDKDPKECVREKEGSAAVLKEGAESAEGNSKGTPSQPAFTNLQKVYWPGENITKGDLIKYYDAVSPYLLPHLKDRPLILKRFPDGIARPPFYQHNVPHPPPFLATVEEEEDEGSLVRYAVCQNKESLLYLANLGVIPMHPFLSRIPHLDKPDHVVFDLDPQEVPFSEVAKQALYLGGLLESLGLKAFPKTSGSRGIHVYVPLKPAYTFEQGLGFAQLVAALAVQERPDAFTVERSLKARPRHVIYLDCMQNSRGKSVASAYSAREKPGATVSAPLTWAELKKGVRLEDFTMASMPARLKKKGDLFAEVLKVGQTLPPALAKLEARLKGPKGPSGKGSRARSRR